MNMTSKKDSIGEKADDFFSGVLSNSQNFNTHYQNDSLQDNESFPYLLDPENRIVRNQIMTEEGGIKTSMYVSTGRSGPTIGAGIDLGQQKMSAFEHSGLSQDLLDKLRPYTMDAHGGHRFGGAEAKEFVQEHPLTISHDEAVDLTNAYYDTEFSELPGAFNKKVEANFGDNAYHFDNLPGGMQTVLADVGLQSGTYGFPKLMNDVTSADWDTALHELETGFPGVKEDREVWRVKTFQADMEQYHFPSNEHDYVFA